MTSSFYRSSLILISAILVLSGFFLYGCDDCVCPDPSTTGKIIINCSPDEAAIPWTLTGPADFRQSGIGDQTFTNMNGGDYTLVWNPVFGWYPPDPPQETQNLQNNGLISFYGTYVPEPGTITINPEPNSISAPWMLSGPDDFFTFGDGSMTIDGLLPGHYTVFWGEVDHWILPTPNTQSRNFIGDRITITGEYFSDPGPYVPIPPASVPMPTTFTMGSTVGGDETPHQVTLTNRFNMASTEVTNGQYVAALQWAYDNGQISFSYPIVSDADGRPEFLFNLDISGYKIRFHEGRFSTSRPDLPVIGVSWYGAAAYCDWLSLQEGLPAAYGPYNYICNDRNPYAALGYRLPTEAEWEFACRAGTTTHFNTGDCLDAGSEANYNGNNPYTDCPIGTYLDRTEDVGSYPANQWGLFDMHGNVWEWCNDLYASYDGDETDPVGDFFYPQGVLRGGSWSQVSYACRSALRASENLSGLSTSYGFRPVKSTQ